MNKKGVRAGAPTQITAFEICSHARRVTIFKTTAPMA